MEDSHLKPTTYFSATTSIGVNNPWRLSAYSSRIRSNIPKTSLFSGGTTSVRVSTESTGSMTNVSGTRLCGSVAWCSLLGSSLWQIRQTSVQHQIVEDLYRLFQLPAYRCYYRREDFYNAWWSESRSAVDGANTESHETDGCTRYRCVLPLLLDALGLAHPVVLGLLCDLLWSDPDKDITGWSENDRGVSFTFGPDVVSRFLQKHDMDLICRAHQVRHNIFVPN